MQADPVTVGSKKEKRQHTQIHEKLISSIRGRHDNDLVVIKYLCGSVPLCVSDEGLVEKLLLHVTLY